MHLGWHQIAFTSELAAGVTPVSIGDRCFVAVQGPDGLRLHDAACPHRGAHLGYGGKLEGSVIVCPFHGKRVALDDDSKQWYVDGYETVVVGGSVFALLSPEHDYGFRGVLESLRESHVLAPGFRVDAAVPPTLVVENAFDTDHFVAVHGVGASPALTPIESRWGELGVEGTFVMDRTTHWQDDVEGGERVETGFRARAFSPTVVMSELRHPGAHDVVITSATPGANGGCSIRVSIGVTPDREGGLPTDRISALANDSKIAFTQDLTVWEHMVAGAPIRYGRGDEMVAAFHEFCERFGLAPAAGGTTDAGG